MPPLPNVKLCHCLSLEECSTHFLTKATGDAGALAKRIEGQAFIKLQSLRNAASRAANEVVDMVVGYVVNCKNDFGEPDAMEQEIYTNVGPSTGVMTPSFMWSAAQQSSNLMRSSTPFGGPLASHEDPP